MQQHKYHIVTTTVRLLLLYGEGYCVEYSIPFYFRILLMLGLQLTIAFSCFQLLDYEHIHTIIDELFCSSDKKIYTLFSLVL